MPNETEILPIVQALRRIKKIIYPLQASVSFHGDKEVIFTLPNYSAKTGELRVIYLGPDRDREWRVEITGEFEKFAKAIREAMKTIRSEGEMLS